MKLMARAKMVQLLIAVKRMTPRIVTAKAAIHVKMEVPNQHILNVSAALAAVVQAVVIMS